MPTLTGQDLPAPALRVNNSTQSSMKGFGMKFVKNICREAEELQSNMPEEGR